MFHFGCLSHFYPPCPLIRFPHVYTLFKKSFIYLFLAVGLCCCTQVFSSCGEQGLLSSWGAQASHCSGFFCWGAWALECELSSMWDFPGSGTQAMFPASAGRFLSIGPQKKCYTFLILFGFLTILYFCFVIFLQIRCCFVKFFF